MISALCIYKLYAWYGVCWELVHKQVDFSLHEPSLVVKNHLGTCKENCGINTLCKTCDCDAENQNYLCLVLRALSVLQTQHVVLSECLLKFWLRKWRNLFPCKNSIHAFCAFQIHWYLEALYCYSQFCFSAFSLPFADIFHSLPSMTDVSWPLLLQDTVELFYIS